MFIRAYEFLQLDTVGFEREADAAVVAEKCRVEGSPECTSGQRARMLGDYACALPSDRTCAANEGRWVRTQHVLESK